MSHETDIAPQIACSLRNVLDSTVSADPPIDTSPGDLIVINNSFIYRDKVKTNKHAEYLCISQQDISDAAPGKIYLCQPPSFHQDVKVFSSKSANIPTTTPLSEAISRHSARLGSLVFLLIGSIDETVESSVEIRHPRFHTLHFQPTRESLAEIDGSSIVINSITDPGTAWAALLEQARDIGIGQQELSANDLEQAFARSFEAIQQDASFLVHMPDAVSISHGTDLMTRIINSIDSQIKSYNAAITRHLEAASSDQRAYTEILRIAYNFASECGNLIRLLVSICDLKPILLWCTLAEQFHLARAFQQLPWARSSKKASLDSYRDMVAGARNHAFHDLISFERSVDVDVTNVSLRARKLRLFSPHSRKKENALEYEDQELIHVLSEFTRAPETAVPSEFWQRNADVMQALKSLLVATRESLNLLHRTTLPN